MNDDTQQTLDAGLDQFGLSQRQAEHLVENLAHSTQVSRRLIINAIRQLGRAAIPVLAAKLKEPRVEFRQAAADVLRQAIDPTDAAVELTAALFDSDWLVRIWAAEALGKVHLRDEWITRALRHAQRNDPLVYVRLSADTALRRIGQPL